MTPDQFYHDHNGVSAVSLIQNSLEFQHCPAALLADDMMFVTHNNNTALINTLSCRTQNYQNTTLCIGRNMIQIA